MQRDELFTIGEFSAITGVGIYSLRYYDEIGALKPEYVDPVSNYRYYGFRQLSRIPAINICKDAGIRLSDLDSFLDDGSVDYSRLLAESRRSIEKIIDGCRMKERGLDLIEDLCSISSRLSEGREVTADLQDTYIWRIPCDETDLETGSAGLLVRLSESARRHGARILPSAYGILRTKTEGGYEDCAFSLLDETAADASVCSQRMRIPGGSYVFSPAVSLSIDAASDLIRGRSEGREPDQLISLALVSEETSGPIYCAAVRMPA